MRLDHLLSREYTKKDRRNHGAGSDRRHCGLVGKTVLYSFERAPKGSTQGKRTKAGAPWGCSSAGRAPALQAGGHRFEPVHLHQRIRVGRKQAGERKMRAHSSAG